ncbi:MAG: SCO family protein [Ferruginibacter sp.]
MKRLTLILLYFIIGPGCHQKQPAQIALPEKQDLPYYNGPDFTPLWFDKNAVPDSIHSIPSFTFIDQNGNTITEKTVANKIYIADFFFTSCPGICPKLTKNLKLVQEAFKDDSNVVLLSHSVTPLKDDPAALKRYALNYGVIDNKWFLLTGNKDSIYTIARKNYFADEDLGMQKDTSDFLHTENMLLIDTKRRIRGMYKGTSQLEMENIIADIRQLEKEMKTD